MSARSKKKLEESLENDKVLVKWLKDNKRESSRLSTEAENMQDRIDVWSIGKDMSGKAISVPIDTKYPDEMKDLRHIWHEAAIETSPGSGKYMLTPRKCRKIMYCFKSCVWHANGRLYENKVPYKMCFVVDVDWLDTLSVHRENWKDAPSNHKIDGEGYAIGSDGNRLKTREKRKKRKLVWFDMLEAAKEGAAGVVDLSGIGLR